MIQSQNSQIPKSGLAHGSPEGSPGSPVSSSQATPTCREAWLTEVPQAESPPRIVPLAKWQGNIMGISWECTIPIYSTGCRIFC